MIGMGRPLATTPRRGDRSPGAGASAAGIPRERGAGEVEEGRGCGERDAWAPPRGRARRGDARGVKRAARPREDEGARRAEATARDVAAAMTWVCAGGGRARCVLAARRYPIKRVEKRDEVRSGRTTTRRVVATMNLVVLGQPPTRPGGPSRGRALLIPGRAAPLGASCRRARGSPTRASARLR